MLFLYNLEPVCLLLAFLISVRVVLNGTNFAALVTVFVTCLLSFTLFESFFAFSPLIFFFLRKHFLPSKPFESTDNSLYRGVGSSSNQQGNNLPERSSAQNQVVPKDRPSGESDYSPDNSPSLGARLRHSDNPNSPLEETLERNRYTVWIGSGSCAFILLSTIRIAWIILRKLDYTQELVKKINEKGWPKFLFFWISHSQPGPVGGRPLFTLLVAVLVGNIIVLYFLMRIMYLVA